LTGRHIVYPLLPPWLTTRLTSGTAEDVLAVGSVSAVLGGTYFDRVHAALLQLGWHVFTDPDVP
jgi:hypothetical protein